MAIYSLLADLIHQCRLARWEEEHCTVDAVELLPRESLPYTRFFCVSQSVKIRVCSSNSVSASFGLDAHSSAYPPPEPFDYNPDATCFVLQHKCERTGFYRLTVGNNTNECVTVAVEIDADLRPPCARTRLEKSVNWIFGWIPGWAFSAVSPPRLRPPDANIKSHSASG